MLTTDLEKLGLTKKEARVYLASLELGETSISRIAKKSNVNRTTIYGLIDTLKSKDLIMTTKKRNKTLYVAQDPRLIKEKIETNGNLINEILPQLLSLANVIDRKPKIRYYEGREEMKKIYREVLSFAGQEFLSFTSESAFYQFDDEFWYKYFVPERIKRKIFNKIILPDTKISREFQTADKEQFRQTKISSIENFKIEAEINLYGDKNIAVISFDEQIGLTIESKKLFNTLKSIFNLIWQTI